MYVSLGEKKKRPNLHLMPLQGLAAPKMQFPPNWSETDMKYARATFFLSKERQYSQSGQKPKTVFGYLSLS